MLHGDAHGGNLFDTPAGWLWGDLEETCRGPREWDLAVLAGQAGADQAGAGTGSAGAESAGQIALAAYAAVSGTPIPAPEALVPFARARQLEGAVWSLGMAEQYPSRYLAVAHELLAAVLGPAR